MLRPISILRFLIIFLPAVQAAIANPYDEVGRGNSREFEIRACDQAAKYYSIYSEWASAELEKIYRNSEPNTAKRDVMLKSFDTEKRKFEEEDYERRKQFYSAFPNNQTRAELAFQIYKYSLMIAYSLAVKNPGRTKIWYQESIEQECKYPSQK